MSKTVENVYILDTTKIMLASIQEFSLSTIKSWFAILEISISIIKCLQEFSNVKTKASLKLYLLVFI